MFQSTRDTEWHLIKAIATEGSNEGGEESGSLGKWDLPEPLFASNLLKILAPASCARVSSTLGNGCTSLSTLSFSSFRLTQMRMAPSFLGTKTIPAHHGVGSSTLEITSIDSIRLSSSLTFWHSDSGTCRGVKSEYGLAGLFSDFSPRRPVAVLFYPYR